MREPGKCKNCFKTVKLPPVALCILDPNTQFPAVYFTCFQLENVEWVLSIKISMVAGV